MVMFTVNDAAGYYSLGAGPFVTKAITQIASGGETGYFFTNSSIYNASMFGVRDADGGWLGTLFYGRTTIDADGRVGFVPDAQIEGEVGGLSVDAFALRYVNSHSSSQALTHAIFDGDDTLIGNKYGGVLAGRGGDDLIIGPAGAACDLDGGGGDDVLHSFAGPGSSHAVSGGGGDDFLFMSDAILRAQGGGGADTFFFARTPNDPSDVDSIQHFQAREDRLQFDPAGFAALADGFTQDNFVTGPAAVDADDFIIFDRSYLYYDPDGNGPQIQVALVAMGANEQLTWKNIVVSDAVPDAGDHGSAQAAAHHDTHALMLHAGIQATGLLP